jgi:hypothetical protein
MRKTVKVLSGNPGVGKTQQFMESIEPNKRYVYAASTRVLALEVMKRLDELDKGYLPIFTSQINEVRSVIHQANQALAAQEASILIITHKCLASVKPELLRGWELCIDEAPKVEQIESTSILAKEWEQVIAPYVGDCDANGHLILNDARLEDAWEIYAQGIEDARHKRVSNRTLVLVLGAMLTPTKNVTATSGKNDKGKDVVRISVEGFVDFTKPFDYANSVTLMGANIEKSLLITHAIKKGFALEVDKKINPRRGLPYILPLVRDNEGAWVSKTMLLTMPDGSVAKEWNPDCFGQKSLDRALAYIGNRKAIFASHEWCKPVLPENVERIPYDSRGLNEWRDRKISIHILHGNLSPDEYGPVKRILKQMDIPLDEGKEALRFAREEDLVVQHAHRTSIRDEANTEDTIHIVTSLTQARRLVDALGGARVLSEALMVDPPERKPTEGQDKKSKERMNLSKKAKALKAQGLSLRKVAEQMGISLNKAYRLTT